MSVFKEAKANIAATVVTAKLDLSAEKATIQAGETATFNLKLSVSGINQTMNEQRLVIDLPVGFKLTDDQDLTIDGVTPTLSTDGTQLTYAFMTPINGLSISKRYVFNTSNYGAVNGTTMSMAAQYFDGDTQLQATDEQVVTITSKAVYGVTDRMVGVLVLNDDGTPKLDADGNATVNSTQLTGIAGDYLVYQLGISAPKSTLGQAYFAPGSIIKLIFLAPAGMTYWKTDNTTLAKYGEPTIQTSNGQTMLTWNIPAPSLAEQQAAKDNLFSGYFDVVFQINASTPALTTLTTQAQIVANSINQNQVTSQIATSKIQTAFDFRHQTIPTEGNDYMNYNWGPKDGNGNASDHAGDHDDPQVYPNATLRFIMMTGPDAFNYSDPIGQNSPYGDYSITKYIATYNVDPHLNVDQMMIYTPASEVNGTVVPLAENPVCDIYVRYQDESDFEATPILTDITTLGWTDMSQYVDNARGVAQLEFVYKVHPQGLITYTYFNMSPKAGYYGTVSNDFTLRIAGFDADDWEEVLISKDGAIVQYSINVNHQRTDRIGTDIHLYDEIGKYVPDDTTLKTLVDQYMQPQTAEIIKPAENTPRVINESTGFVNQTNGLVTPGDNVLQVMVENNQASVQSFSRLKSYVILPKNVTYTGNDANVTAEKLADGTTKLTIDWAATALAPNQQNRLNLSVTIDAKARVNSMNVTLYSTVAEKDTVVPGVIDPDLQTDVQMVDDTADIDGNPDTTTVFQNTKTYVMDVASHQIHIKATATNAANQTGSEVTAQAGQNAQFGLLFTDASDGGLGDVTIIGTLPVADDTSITNPDDARGTTAAVTMSGPIILPASWASLATVTYALKSDPTAYVDASAVTDFSQVVGFKITTNGDDYLPASDASQLVVPVKIAKNALLDQAAYISYQVSANGLTATEGTKGGLLIDLGPDGQPGSGIWVRTKTVTRTIDYRDAETNAVIAPSVTQTATVKQNITKNPTTGELVYGDWTLTNGGWTAVKSPNLAADGYDTASGNADAVTIGDDTTNTTVTVTYAHQIKTTTEAKTVTRTINYLDKDTNAVLADAKTQQVVFTRTNTEDMVNHAKTNGAWTPASGQFDVQTSPDLSAKGYQAPDQASVAALTVTPAGQNSVVNVYYEKQTVTPTDPTGPTEPTTPVTPTTPVEPVTPTTPVEPTTPDKPDDDTTTDKQENKVPASKPTQTKTGTTQTSEVDANGTVKSEADQLTLSKSNETATTAKKLPQTDEQSSPAGFIGVMLATMLGLVGLGRKKRDEE
ncbi:hypothetical protein FD04_GL000348 [Secundilactobacillus odoratitofui DSM 19909 = JCM 15043]|uniref:Gram-positive cocci surface proteins LPxTG domain-containing protein n=3 Tax=Secundilactobacillus odoratitofui TaxID=480930 RepID=A0A0R1LS72_9LACO|nr:hypothetical protein FD04_GL000348 [Secundilactobacillus odoratitofui DSM 19909 = JCM 15043]